MLGAAVTQQARAESGSLDEIQRLDAELRAHFRGKLLVQPALTRSLVSFQANKARPVYRWYKFKEAFSAGLVEYLLEKYQIAAGRLLDPFAGSGTALFAAAGLGLDADGIELLPIGQQIVRTKQLLDAGLSAEDCEHLTRWADGAVWQRSQTSAPLPELHITKGAYPSATREAIERYLGAVETENAGVQEVLRFALLCVLESVSYTRKDGQYLRWDHRSGRTWGKKQFDKGDLPEFEWAIRQKLHEILADIAAEPQQWGLFDTAKAQGQIRLYSGSCLDILPTLDAETYDVIITSPPYCNRYDYTRTYALELALLGVDEAGLAKLRQDMLSCTVENREKDLLAINPRWVSALAAVDGQHLLQMILAYLEDQKARGLLNNTGIPRMVRGYFHEMACVIAECSRVLKHGGKLFMVNDNVRYAGASISVDLILSALAESLGFRVVSILVLPSGKGNSSQQMGEHGREELRKCIYVWSKA
jgi:DNA modification methylase